MFSLTFFHYKPFLLVIISIHGIAYTPDGRATHDFSFLILGFLYGVHDRMMGLYAGKMGLGLHNWGA